MKIIILSTNQIKPVNGGGLCLCSYFNRKNATPNRDGGDSADSCFHACLNSGYQRWQYSESNQKFHFLPNVHDCYLEKQPPFFDLDNGYLDGYEE